MRYTFHKSEKLRHKSLIDKLFEEGEHITVFPLRLTWRAVATGQLADNFKDSLPDQLGQLQLMITVPKRKLHHAVDRVRMRRLIREAWRLQRLPLKEYMQTRDDIRTLSVAIVYLADHLYSMDKISDRVDKLMLQLREKLEKT